MWIFTKDGFFSVVNDRFCGPEELMVRSRSLDDLIRFANKMRIPAPEIIKIGQADYRYRLKVSRDTWAKYLAHAAYGLDYDNVKGNLCPYNDNERHDAYLNVWASLFNWQHQTERRTHTWSRKPLKMPL